MAKSRKRRKQRKIHPLLILATLIAAGELYAHRTELGALRVTLIIITAGMVLGAIIGHRIGRRRQAVVLTKSPPRKAAPAKPPKPAADPALPATKQARRNGWLPPDTPKQGMLTLTPECAGDECALCPDPGGCSCPCEHDAAKIVARNAAHYDQKHDNDIPPY